MDKRLRQILARLASGQTEFYLSQDHWQGRMKCTILSVDLTTDFKNILIRCEDDDFEATKTNTYDDGSTEEIKVSAKGVEERYSHKYIDVDNNLIIL